MNDEKNTYDADANKEDYDILQSAVEYMDTFLDEVNNIVNEFRSGKYIKLNELSNLFEGFQWIYSAINKINDEYSANIDIDVQRFTEAYSAAVEALRNSDIVLLTDILEYEVIEMVQGWFGSK